MRKNSFSKANKIFFAAVLCGSFSFQPTAIGADHLSKSNQLGDQRAAAVSSYTFVDLNGNGLLDGREPPIDGVRVIQDCPNGDIQSTVSNEFGFANFALPLNQGQGSPRALICCFYVQGTDKTTQTPIT